MVVLNLAYNKNKLHKSLEHWSRNILSFDFLEKNPGEVSPPHFVWDFSSKIFLMLFPITSCKFGLYVHCNCFLSRLWNHKLWNQFYLSNQSVCFFAWPKSQDKNVNIMRWNKKYFSSSLKGFQLPKIVLDLRVRLLSKNNISCIIYFPSLFCCTCMNDNKQHER